MHLSDEGLRLIRSFEGYHRRLQNGDCAAYLCPAKVPTIGYGVTDGVKLGMVWTAEKADEAFRHELTKFENAVIRLVTVEINQNEFDALVSFAYNCGEGALKGSTLLKKLNKGDRAGAAKQFPKWNRGGGRMLPGLVSRRAREMALFLKPVVKPEEPAMPQQVSKSTEVTPTQVAVGTGAVAGGATVLPAPPDLTPLTNWQAWGDTVAGLGTWALMHPVATVGVVGVVGVLTFWPKAWRPQ